MKKIYNSAFLVLVILCLSIFVFVGCGGNNVADTVKDNDVSSGTSNDTSDIIESNGNILVAYFSRRGENWQVGYIEKGNTEIVAEMIAEETKPTYSLFSRSFLIPTYTAKCLKFPVGKQAKMLVLP